MTLSLWCRRLKAQPSSRKTSLCRLWDEDSLARIGNLPSQGSCLAAADFDDIDAIMEEPNQDVDSLSHVDPDLDPAVGISKWLFRGKVTSPGSDTGRGCSCGLPSGCSIRWSQGLTLLGERKAASAVVCLTCQSLCLLPCDQRRTGTAGVSMLRGNACVLGGSASASGMLQPQICCPPSCQLWPAAAHWLSRCLPPLLSSHPALPGGGV